MPSGRALTARQPSPGLSPGLSPEMALGLALGFALSLGACDDGDGGGEADPEPGYCDDVASWPSGHVELEAQVLDLTNDVREAGAVCAGQQMPPVPPLSLDTSLRCAARKHAKRMHTEGFFAHVDDQGDGPGERAIAAGYSYLSVGENIASGHLTAEAVVDGWVASPGHCKNLMKASFTELGVGYFPGGPNNHLWVQVFGKPQ